MKKWLIKNLGLKGSWKWAKKQMLNGKLIHCKHWNNYRKLCIYDKENQIIRQSYQQFCIGIQWDYYIHSLKNEDFTDYEIFNW